MEFSPILSCFTLRMTSKQGNKPKSAFFFRKKTGNHEKMRFCGLGQKTQPKNKKQKSLFSFFKSEKKNGEGSVHSLVIRDVITRKHGFLKGL